MMRVNQLVIALVAAGLAVINAGAALANSPSGVLTITQSDGKTWSEDVAAAGLISFNAATGDFTLLQGSSVGQSITTDNVDAWVWKEDALGGYWDWHSAETVSGNTVALGGSTTPADPWMSSFQLRTLAGHGDPDLSYGFTAKNNTGLTQTYAFTVGETIVPTVSGANTVSAEFLAALITTDGGVSIAPTPGKTTIQQFALSSDNGATLVNAGVDLGTSFASAASTTYSVASGLLGGPAGTWNYMQITTSFTLSAGKDVASIAGSAQILPVPEADQYALLLAGLGLIGFVARRRTA